MENWQDNYIKAMHFAALAHGDQRYPEKPYSYLVHLSIVTTEAISVAVEQKIDLDMNLIVQCAILHDTIEDTDVVYSDVFNTFGKDVADGVLALTKNEKLDQSVQMADSISRIKKQPKEIWIIKMADRIANLQVPLRKWDDNKIKKYRNEAILIYQELKEANEFLANRLSEKIKQYEREYMKF